MSEERFDRIDNEIAGLKDRFDGVDARFVAVDARFDTVDARLVAVDARFDAVDVRFDALDQRIGVLHENVLDIIAASTERNAVTKGEFKEAIADLKETLSRRLAPLEVVVRQHSLDIADLKTRR